jgi:hypothetical protein
MPDTYDSSLAEAVFTSTPTPVHAGGDHAVERLLEQRLVHVVLVLPDADRLGVDLHQLGQRILQAAARSRPRPRTVTSWSGSSSRAISEAE